MKKVCFVCITVVVMLSLMVSTAFAADVDVGASDVGLMDVFAAVVMLAVLIESLAEVVKAAIAPATLPKWVWLLITSIFGAVFCILFAVDFFAALGFAGGAAATILGQIITGVAVGAGSGFVHTLLGRLTAAKDWDKAAAAGQLIASADDTDSSDASTG